MLMFVYVAYGYKGNVFLGKCGKKLFASTKKFVTFATLLPRNLVGAGR